MRLQPKGIYGRKRRRLFCKLKSSFGLFASTCDPLTKTPCVSTCPSPDQILQNIPRTYATPRCFPSITWINWSSCLLHDKNQESIGNQCTSSVMFCSPCPLSVRQLIDRINLALTDQSIYPTRMHLLDLIQNDPQAFSFCMAAISPHLPLKKKYRPRSEGGAWEKFMAFNWLFSITALALSEATWTAP